LDALLTNPNRSSDGPAETKIDFDSTSTSTSPLTSTSTSTLTSAVSALLVGGEEMIDTGGTEAGVGSGVGAPPLKGFEGSTIFPLGVLAGAREVLEGKLGFFFILGPSFALLPESALGVAFCIQLEEDTDRLAGFVEWVGDGVDTEGLFSAGVGGSTWDVVLAGAALSAASLVDWFASGSETTLLTGVGP
jgi:hypothetical protein